MNNMNEIIIKDKYYFPYQLEGPRTLAYTMLVTNPIIYYCGYYFIKGPKRREEMEGK